MRPRPPAPEAARVRREGSRARAERLVSPAWLLGEGEGGSPSDHLRLCPSLPLSLSPSLSLSLPLSLSPSPPLSLSLSLSVSLPLSRLSPSLSVSLPLSLFLVSLPPPPPSPLVSDDAPNVAFGHARVNGCKGQTGGTELGVWGEMFELGSVGQIRWITDRCPAGFKDD